MGEDMKLSDVQIFIHGVLIGEAKAVNLSTLEFEDLKLHKDPNTVREVKGTFEIGETFIAKRIEEKDE